MKKTYLRVKAIFITILKGISFFWREHHFLVPISLWKKYALRFFDRVKKRSGQLYLDPLNDGEYNEWIENQEVEEVNHIFSYKPLISILMPICDTQPSYLKKSIVSILEQTYEHLEVYLIKDSATNDMIVALLDEFVSKDSRIKIITRNASENMCGLMDNVLDAMSGDFLGLLNNNGVLEKNTLYENVKLLNKNPKVDFIYSDEDRLDTNGIRCKPHFKPDFSPDTLLSFNYIGCFSIIRTSIARLVGGFTLDSSYYNLFLKVSEITKNIYHIPKILYHQQVIPQINHKQNMCCDEKNAIEAALKRRKISAIVSQEMTTSYCYLSYSLPIEPSVSIIIPTRDHWQITKQCIDSIYEMTNYSNFEIILVDNNSCEEKTLMLFDQYKKDNKNFSVIKADMDFNYSKINNLAIKNTTSDVIVLLNNDTKIISKDWLSAMVGYAIQPHIGAVGPKLLYEDGTVQHGGVILGLGGVAAHAFLKVDREEQGVYGRLKVPYNYGAITAACLAIERKKMYEVELLNEELKVAYNDIELNIKLLQKGYYNVFLPQIELYHLESKSRGLDTTTEKYKQFLKERDYIIRNYSNYLKKDPFYNENYSNKECDANFLLDKRKK